MLVLYLMIKIFFRLLDVVLLRKMFLCWQITSLLQLSCEVASPEKYSKLFFICACPVIFLYFLQCDYLQNKWPFTNMVHKNYIGYH